MKNNCLDCFCNVFTGRQKKKLIQQSINIKRFSNQLILNLELLNPQDQQVYNLKTFVQTFIENIDIILKNKEQILLKQDEYELDVEFDRLKFQLNGCEYTCPCCNRKCDQDNDSIHTHQCQNGHQIRGINDSPSLFTCQEILDGCMIITLETNLKRTWKDVKKAHLNWNFQNLFQESNNQNINKWKNVWNRGLGKLICQHLEKQLNHQVIFSQKQEIPIQVSNFHYILILDDSGSMKGDKWSQAKDGALNCIKQLENTDSAKVSVIIFNSNARIVAECQKPNFQEMNNKIVYSGGGICFEPPFKLVLELIEKYHDFNKIQILFYTDGEASYPQNAVDKLCSLSYNIRRLISIIACSGEKYSQQLALLIEKFKQYIQSAELKNSVGRLIYQVNGIINYKIQQQSLSQKSLPFFLNFRYLNYLGFQGFIQYFCIKQFTRINLKIQKFLIKLKICVKRVKTYLFILSQ